MNRKKQMIAAGLWLVAAGFCSVDAQDRLFVLQNNGDGVWSENLAGVRKITFTAEEMSVWGEDALYIQNFKLSEVRRLDFNPKSGIKTISQEEDFVSVYPNPATDFINIANTDGGGVVEIYSTDGRLCLSRREWRGEQINVSHLSKGLYILKVNNEIVKFRKS